MKERLLAFGSAFILILCYPPGSQAASPHSPITNEDSAYLRMITARAGKIVAALGLRDSASFYRLRGVVADQYRSLNSVYTERDRKLKALSGDKAQVDSVKRLILKDADEQVGQLHQAYLARLGKLLTPNQVDQIKDGMTYSILEVTYKGYQEELPNLTADQKALILADLTEAREHAMDAGSSKEKHAWFGKYKGRINNYLSSQGIDMKKAGEEWEKRRKAAASNAGEVK
ncbi:MAG TPA: DUF3826 domain-containing protein [Puia sp.]|nr:DUF3826 domain-containing protein [Puia sp.]